MEDTLYHGSGNMFNKFDLSKAGEGSGNDVHGFGIYLTEDREVAKFYAEDIPSENSYIYTVEIPSSLTLIGWEDTVDEYYGNEIVKEFESRIDDELELEDLKEVLGMSDAYYGEYPLFSSLYDYLVDVLGNKKTVSEFLTYAGIDGVKFRSKENGFDTFNYVIFDPRNVMIRGVENIDDEKTLNEYESDLNSILEYIQSHDVHLRNIRKKL